MEFSTFQKIILKRDGGKCFVCNGTNNLEIHHIIFKKEGGLDDFYNLVTICRKCHRKNHRKIYKHTLDDLFYSYTHLFNKPENWQAIIDLQRNYRHNVYNKSIPICEDDLKLLRDLNTSDRFNKKSLAGTLSFIINNFNFKKYGRPRHNRKNGADADKPKSSKCLLP